MEEIIVNGKEKAVEPGRLLEEIKPVFNKEETLQ